ncbi:hypothetical protein Fmac_032877 [Flemingia macrophylla]|uniref:Uncharacterized protein n=1 Tax=Flemingia macrophylla TaxID=520843 RepID=A0ABD1L654_9FABA
MTTRARYGSWLRVWKVLGTPQRRFRAEVPCDKVPAQSGVDEHHEAYAANTYSRPRQQQRQGT